VIIGQPTESLIWKQRLNMGELTIYPMWKAKVSEILEVYEIGELVPHQYFYDLFDVYPNEPGITVDAYKSRQIDFMQNLIGFRDCLLIDHKIALVNVRTEGYRMVPPSEQAELAERQLHQHLTKMLDKTIRRVSYTRMEELEDHQKQRHRDVAVRLKRLSLMASQERKQIPKLREQITFESEGINE